MVVFYAESICYFKCIYYTCSKKEKCTVKENADRNTSLGKKGIKMIFDECEVCLEFVFHIADYIL